MAGQFLEDVFEIGQLSNHGHVIVSRED